MININSAIKNLRKKVKYVQKGPNQTCVVGFKNSYHISILLHDEFNKDDRLRYCDKDSCEIAPLNQGWGLYPFPINQKDVHTHLKAVGISCDQVKGYVTQEELALIMKTISRF